MFREVTCNKCGRVHVAVPRVFAEGEIAQAAEIHAKLNPGSPPRVATIADYEKCLRCGNTYLNFRNAMPGDCPIGCTLTSVLDFAESTQSKDPDVSRLQ